MRHHELYKHKHDCFPLNDFLFLFSPRFSACSVAALSSMQSVAQGGPAHVPACASIRVKSQFQPYPPCGSGRERSLSWGGRRPPAIAHWAAHGTRRGMRPSIKPCSLPFEMSLTCAHLTLPMMRAQVRHFSPLGPRRGPRRAARWRLVVATLSPPPFRRRRRATAPSPSAGYSFL